MGTVSQLLSAALCRKIVMILISRELDTAICFLRTCSANHSFKNRFISRCSLRCGVTKPCTLSSIHMHAISASAFSFQINCVVFVCTTSRETRNVESPNPRKARLTGVPRHELRSVAQLLSRILRAATCLTERTSDGALLKWRSVVTVLRLVT